MNSKQLFAKFQTEDILVEQGRLLYAVLYAFSQSGYRIDLFDNFDRERLGRCGKLVPVMPGVTMTREPPSHPENCIYLYDKLDRSLAHLNWQKKVQVRDDLFSPYCGKDPMIMPYAMHPRQTSPDPDPRLERLRTQNRKMRIFFSGDTKDYGRSRIRYPAHKLPRLEIINTLRDHMATDVLLVQDEATRDSLGKDGAPYVDRCVIMDTSRIWIEEPTWLETLANADFFLSPPGIVMPMCHNIIEAMAVGTIPLTNYPEWMRPNLVHMENCIVFDDKDDLVNKVKLALGLSKREIARMRANVVDYYCKHLDPRIFVLDLVTRQACDVSVLLYTENNVRDNWQRLNKHSVLMQAAKKAEKTGQTICILHNLISNIRAFSQRAKIRLFV
jgi:hypothetical protein